MVTFAIRVPVYSNVTLKPKSGNFPQWILVKEEVIKRKKKRKRQEIIALFKNLYIHRILSFIQLMYFSNTIIEHFLSTCFSARS